MRRALLWVLLVGIGVPFAACGGSAASAGRDAATTDTGSPQDSAGGDVIVDGATSDASEDAGGDAATPRATAFTSGTSGGATVSSANYRAKLFIAPTVPVGTAQTSSYRVGLGPGATTNAR